jgi:hypothetical protein
MRNLPPAHLNSTMDASIRRDKWKASIRQRHREGRRAPLEHSLGVWHCHSSSLPLPCFSGAPLDPGSETMDMQQTRAPWAPDRNGRVTSVTDKLGRQGRRAPLEQLPWSKALPQFEPSFTVSPLDTLHKKNLPKVLITIHANLGFNEPCFQQSQEELVR